MRPTRAWVRMKPPSVSHALEPTSTTCRPGVSPTTPPSQGRNRWPSLRKKNDSTRVSTRLIRTELTALTPISTPVVMVLALERSRSWAVEITELTCSSVARLLSTTQVSSWLRPSEALVAISLAWVPTEGATRNRPAPTIPRLTRMVAAAARAAGNLAFSRRIRAGGSSTVVRISARITGSRMLQVRETTRPSRYAPTKRIAILRVQRDIQVTPWPSTCSRDGAGAPPEAEPEPGRESGSGAAAGAAAGADPGEDTDMDSSCPGSS